MDYWCDGHMITADDPDDARRETVALYGHRPDIVRPWVPGSVATITTTDPGAEYRVEFADGTARVVGVHQGARPRPGRRRHDPKGEPVKAIFRMMGRNAQGEYVFVRPKAVEGVRGSYFVNETVEIAPEAFWGKPEPTDWQQVARAAGLELLPWQVEFLERWEATGMPQAIPMPKQSGW